MRDPRGLLGVSGFYCLMGNCFSINLERSDLEASPSLPTHSQLLLSTLCHPDQVSPWSDPAQGSWQLCQHGGTLAATTASMSDFWHKLGCCVVEKPQPVSTSSLVQPFQGGEWAQQGLMAFIPLQKKRRRRIDRSMIGEPMNFVHLTHIGSGDMAAGEGLPMVPQSYRRAGGLGWGAGDQRWGVGAQGWVTGGVFGVVGVGFGVVESHGWVMGVALGMLGLSVEWWVLY